jgi:hypothetical protein
MSADTGDSWKPFRPTETDLQSIANDVADIPVIQRKLVDEHKNLHLPDRVAHEFQIAGGKIKLTIANDIPEQLKGIGLFEPGAQFIGIGRISTGLGTPHLETNPDFLGAMAAFQIRRGERVDFLAINDPSSPADDHLDFMDVLRATGESAGAHIPLIGDWGAYDVGNLMAEQTVFALALNKRMGLIKAGKCLAHITKQTLRTFLSRTAWQPYWTGIVELAGQAGKFTFVPTRDENPHPGFRPGEYHLSDDWRRRQAAGDIDFRLYWIPYLNEQATPTGPLTHPWAEDHKMPVGMLTFPRTDAASDAAQLWASLAAEIGANVANWVANKDNTVKYPSTEFANARRLAYALSQKGRGALDVEHYRTVFETGEIGPELKTELLRRRDAKRNLGHVDSAPNSYK